MKIDLDKIKKILTEDEIANDKKRAEQMEVRVVDAQTADQKLLHMQNVYLKSIKKNVQFMAWILIIGLILNLIF